MACLRQLAQREAAEVCEYAMSLAKNTGDKEISGGSEFSDWIILLFKNFHGGEAAIGM